MELVGTFSLTSSAKVEGSCLGFVDIWLQVVVFVSFEDDRHEVVSVGKWCLGQREVELCML